MTRPFRCYTTAELCRALDMPARTFFRLKAQGKLPFLEELKPRLGRRARYRAELVDRYLDGTSGLPRVGMPARRLKAAG